MCQILYVPNNMLRNRPFFFLLYFNLFCYNLLINKPYSSRDLTIFMRSSSSSHGIVKVVTTDTKTFYGFLYLLRMLPVSAADASLLILTVSKHFQLMIYVHFSLMVNHFLVTVQEFYQKILLITLLQIAVFVITLYKQIDCPQKLYKTMRLVFQLVTVYVEDQSYHQNHKSYLMKVLE